MTTIDTTVNGDTAIILVSGPVNGEAAEQLKTAYQALPEERVRHLVLDVSAVPFIGSAGLGKLLLFYKRISSTGGTVEIRGASPDIQELLRELRLDLLFKLT
ncbi:MAG TPA: STAS domain-containing protein [Candidatus Hydrogenedentes bacterium]|nr:STAS domain-containing protein [Candidatus Hydrogenedentota bacterium]